MSKIVVTKKFYEIQNLIGTNDQQNQQGTFGVQKKEESEIFDEFDQKYKQDDLDTFQITHNMFHTTSKQLFQDKRKRFTQLAEKKLVPRGIQRKIEYEPTPNLFQGICDNIKNSQNYQQNQKILQFLNKIDIENEKDKINQFIQYKKAKTTSEILQKQLNTYDNPQNEILLRKKEQIILQNYQRFQNLRNKAIQIQEQKQQLDFQEIREIMDANKQEFEKLFKQVDNQKARFKIFSREYYSKKKY